MCRTRLEMIFMSAACRFNCFSFSFCPRFVFFSFCLSLTSHFLFCCDSQVCGGDLSTDRLLYFNTKHQTHLHVSCNECTLHNYLGLLLVPLWCNNWTKWLFLFFSMKISLMRRQKFHSNGATFWTDVDNVWIISYSHSHPIWHRVSFWSIKCKDVCSHCRTGLIAACGSAGQCATICAMDTNWNPGVRISF